MSLELGFSGSEENENKRIKALYCRTIGSYAYRDAIGQYTIMGRVSVRLLQ